jgi:hypothetical protein
MVYLLNMVIFHGKLLNYQRVQLIDADWGSFFQGYSAELRKKLELSEE